MPTNSISVDQLNIKADNAWKKLDEIRIVDGNALYCKENVTTGLLMKDNQVQIVPVTWSNGTPTVGNKVGYIDANGDFSSIEQLENSTTRTHNLTDKLDADDYLGGLTWDTLAARFTWDDLEGNATSEEDTHTANLNLLKPSRLSTTAVNGNMDILDAALGGIKSKTVEIPTGASPRTITISGDAYQQYLVMTQRCGLFLVWNMNGTIQSEALSDVVGVSFSASGIGGITLEWNQPENLWVTVISGLTFTLT